MNITDTIVLSCLVFLVWRGLSRGLLRSILGPLSMIIMTIAAFVYYKITNNIAISLAIGLIGPIVFHFGLFCILKSLGMVLNPEGKINILSRILGAIITTLWGSVFIVMTLVMCALIPPSTPGLSNITKDIFNSVSYKAVSPLSNIFLPKSKTANTPLSKEQRMQQLSNDTRIQELINDPVVQKAIEEKNFAALMTNPKIMAIAQDPQLLQTMMELYKDLKPEDFQ